MAEIHVQRKAGPAPWVWVVAFLAILVLAWLVLSLAGRRERVGVVVPAQPSPTVAADAAGSAMTGGEDASGAQAAGPKVDAFVSYVRAAGPQPGRDHRYTAEAIRRLAEALQAMAGGAVAEADVRDQLGQMRQMADRLQAEPTSREHAGMTRRAFVTAADVVARLAEDHPATKGHVAPLRQAVQDLNPDRPLLQQAATVDEFLERAAEMLTHLARERG